RSSICTSPLPKRSRRLPRSDGSVSHEQIVQLCPLFIPVAAVLIVESVGLCIKEPLVFLRIPNPIAPVSGDMARPYVRVEAFDGRPQLFVGQPILIAGDDDVASTTPRRRQHL